MAGKTSIEWTHAPGFVGGVWNPTTGCTRVSAGCDNCYAFALHDRRYKVNLDASRAMGDATIADTRLQQDEADDSDVRPLPFPKQYDLPFSRVQLLEDRLDVPLRTRRPTCYFVDSMADLFHEDVPDIYIARVFQVMREAQWHRFLILTKRPDRMRELVSRRVSLDREYADKFLGCPTPEMRTSPAATEARAWAERPYPNVWLGTSVEDQAAADERIPHLLATPAPVRFLSCEPLLGPVDLNAWLPDRPCHWCGHPRGEHYFGENGGPPHCCWGAFKDECACQGYASPIALDLHWVIVGGESGARARPLQLHWIRSLIRQCRTAGVAIFVKQLGRVFDDVDGNGLGTRRVRLDDRKGGDITEWPEDLRIREWPHG